MYSANYIIQNIFYFISNQQIACVLVCCVVECVGDCVVASFVVLPSF